MNRILKLAIFTVYVMSGFIAGPVIAQPMAAASADYHYTGTLVINAETRNIKANWLITVYDQEETAITFLLRDTLGDIQVTGESVEEVKTEKQEKFGGFWATSIKLAAPPVISSPENRVIQIAYSGVLIPEPMDNLINAIEPGRVELNMDSLWFPIDSGFTKQLSADLNVYIGQGWQGVTTGEAIAIEDGFRICELKLDLS